MRAREIIKEDYNTNLESDLTNILTGAKGSGAQDINTQQLVAQLTGMGYSVDIHSLMSLLSRNPLVLNATPTSVKLKSPNDGQQGADRGQDSASAVGAMAQKATKIG